MSKPYVLAAAFERRQAVALLCARPKRSEFVAVYRPRRGDMLRNGGRRPGDQQIHRSAQRRDRPDTYTKQLIQENVVMNTIIVIFFV